MWVVRSVKLFDFMYWYSILDWYGQPCHKEQNNKIIDFIFIWHVNTMNKEDKSMSDTSIPRSILYHVIDSRVVFQLKNTKNATVTYTSAERCSY